MPWDVFKQSVAIAKENQIATLNFFGGEPLLNPLFSIMLQTALENGFFVILATNCRPFAEKRLFTKFLNITKHSKRSIQIVTARDKFHLEYFDPVEIINNLKVENYEVVVNDYSNHTILLSEHNVHNQELQKLDTNFSCCKDSWTDYLGVLPDGGWTICPPSLEAFGNIFSDSLGEITRFKRGLSLNYEAGCTECLKDFKDFRRKFEVSRSHKELTAFTPDK